MQILGIDHVQLAMPAGDKALPGFDRVYVSGPFGNRLELMEETA
jgi:hypothetical protein